MINNFIAALASTLVVLAALWLAGWILGFIVEFPSGVSGF